MTEPGPVFVVGLGPGERTAMTEQAASALLGADVIIGYAGYFDWLGDLAAGKECVALPLGEEPERGRLAVRLARTGRRVAVISSGDPGIYGMASLVLEVASREAEPRPEVVVVPGVSAVNAAAARLGAPLGHDFAVISLSDLLTPWPVIERRLRAAAEGDFVVALLNPRSRRRKWQLDRACTILRSRRAPETPVGVVRNAYRPGEEVRLTTLAELATTPVDMFTTVIVGSTTTLRTGNQLLTPRGYGSSLREQGPLSPASQRNRSPILEESFRLIEREVDGHRFGPRDWPVVRRMIHASGDVELAKAVCLHRDPVTAAVRALRERVPVVTDVTMVAAGINRRLLDTLGVQLHCFIDDPEVQRRAEASGQTRSHWAMEQAIGEVGEAVYVIGNAPTALLAVCGAVRREAVFPRAILAVPVGFVSVAESKEDALSLSVPVLAVRGRKGGSAVAAAAVNALLELAAEEAP